MVDDERSHQNVAKAVNTVGLSQPLLFTATLGGSVSSATEPDEKVKGLAMVVNANV